MYIKEIKRIEEMVGNPEGVSVNEADMIKNLYVVLENLASLLQEGKCLKSHRHLLSNKEELSRYFDVLDNWYSSVYEAVSNKKYGDFLFSIPLNYNVDFSNIDTANNEYKDLLEKAEAIAQKVNQIIDELPSKYKMVQASLFNKSTKSRIKEEMKELPEGSIFVNNFDALRCSVFFHSAGVANKLGISFGNKKVSQPSVGFTGMSIRKEIEELTEKFKKEGDISSEEADRIVFFVKITSQTGNQKYRWCLDQSLKKWYRGVNDAVRKGKKGNFVTTIMVPPDSVYSDDTRDIVIESLLNLKENSAFHDLDVRKWRFDIKDLILTDRAIIKNPGEIISEIISKIEEKYADVLVQHEEDCLVIKSNRIGIISDLLDLEENVIPVHSNLYKNMEQVEAPLLKLNSFDVRECLISNYPEMDVWDHEGALNTEFIFMYKDDYEKYKKVIEKGHRWIRLGDDAAVVEEKVEVLKEMGIHISTLPGFTDVEPEQQQFLISDEKLEKAKYIVEIGDDEIFEFTKGSKYKEDIREAILKISGIRQDKYDLSMEDDFITMER